MIIEEQLTSLLIKEDINKNDELPDCSHKHKQLSVLSYCLDIIELCSDGLISETLWLQHFQPKLLSIHAALNPLLVNNDIELSARTAESARNNDKNNAHTTEIEQLEHMVLQLRVEVLLERKKVCERQKETHLEHDRLYFSKSNRS